jgi:Ran GTPase-activating protein (RanGAP) involved in mRNA processing and transport
VKKDKPSNFDKEIQALENEEIRTWEIEPMSMRFNDDDEGHMEQLIEQFNKLDLDLYNGLTLSGNSYGIKACKWIANSILQKWHGLREVNFSNMFVSRTKDEIPIALKSMMDQLLNKKITKLDLSHNAFGP